MWGDSMRDRYSQFTEEQVEEHRLEIENRIRKLFWTISGDYTLDVKPDVEKFSRSRYIALYDAMKQGAFARYFDTRELGLYVLKKTYLSRKERPLLELARLCVDAAVYPLILGERPGTEEMRKKAFEDILHQEEASLNQTFFGQVKIAVMRNYLENDISEMPDVVRETAERIASLKDAKNTQDIVTIMEEIYNGIFDQEFEEEHGNLKQVLKVPPMALGDAAWQDCLTDEQMEEIIKKCLAGIGKDRMSLDIKEKRKKRRVRPEASAQGEEDEPEFSDEAAEKRVQEYVELNFGKNYQTPLEQEKRKNRLCKGIHANCILHDTEGILHDPVKVNNQYRFNQLQFEKNKMYYYIAV